MAIVNAAGQRVYSTQVVELTQQIQTANWNKGIYFVLVYLKGMDKPLVKKITKTTY